MNTFVRVTVFLAVGLLLVILFDIAGTRLGLLVDIPWMLIVAAAFAWPVETAPIAGLLFGLVLDGLSGGGALVYTFSYGGFGLIALLVRRAFFLGGLVPAWIMAVVGAELLWLFFGLFSQAIIMVGGAARNPGWLSPFLLSTLILYPLVHVAAGWLLRKPGEAPRGVYYPRVGKTIRI
jgi:hypothetical protein